MSRIANNPVAVPDNVEVDMSGAQVRVKGGKGELTHTLHALVNMDRDGALLKVAPRNNSKSARALAGTTRALLQNMVTGVSEGFEITLEIVGVGYRAQATTGSIGLTLGFSHPVELAVPDGVTVETPSQTQIIIKGADKQKVGQVAADIRNYRPPEPYKGKGVRYANEQILRKEAKKA